MKTVFQAETAAAIEARIASLRADSVRHWGRMNAAQAMEHCARGVEWALGDTVPPRMLMGRMIGRFVKPLVLRDGEPMRRNSPTAPDLVVAGECDFEAERGRLLGLLARFIAEGPGGFKTRLHGFFGPLTPEEWGILMYKHLDHHLRQFGV